MLASAPHRARGDAISRAVASAANSNHEALRVLGRDPVIETRAAETNRSVSWRSGPGTTAVWHARAMTS